MGEQDVPRGTTASPEVGKAAHVEADHPYRDRGDGICADCSPVTITEPGMETVGEVIERAFGFGNPGDWPVCGLCGGSFPRLIEQGEGKVSICRGCETARDQAAGLAEEVRRLAAKMDVNVARWLTRAGMSEREQRAELGRIPERLQREVPAGTVASMTSGMVPAHGFGMAGAAGVGKTFALAALVRRMAEVRIAGELPSLGRMAFRPWMSWVRWPEHTNRLRVLASRDDGVAEGDEIMERLAKVEVLVLDDLGAERWKADDWMASLLDLLVDMRFNAELPTWYTTHLNKDEIIDRYGARLFSRLAGDNPLLYVSGVRDLRIVR